MTISGTATPSPLLAPNTKVQFVDKDGILTNHGFSVLNQLMTFINGTNRIVPCNATGTNVITLTMLNTSPLITKYNDFDTFRFTAAATSTGLVTALVATPQGNLSTLKVFANGGGQITAGDITISKLYDFLYVDSLDSGVGGFVLR